MLLFCSLFLFFESRKLLLNFVATPLYLYANAKLLFTFVAVGNRLFFVTILGNYETIKNSNDAPFFCAIFL